MKLIKIFFFLITILGINNIFSSNKYFPGPLILVPGWGSKCESTYRDSGLIDYFESYGIKTHAFDFDNTSNINLEDPRISKLELKEEIANAISQHNLMYNDNTNLVRLIADSGGGLPVREYVTSQDFNYDITRVGLIAVPLKGADPARIVLPLKTIVEHGINYELLIAAFGVAGALIPPPLGPALTSACVTLEVQVSLLIAISTPLNQFFNIGLHSPLTQYLSPNSSALQELNLKKYTKGNVVYNIFSGYGYPTIGPVQEILLETTIITGLLALPSIFSLGPAAIVPLGNLIGAISTILLETNGDFVVMVDSAEGRGIDDIKNHLDKKISRHAMHIEANTIISIYGGKPKDRYKEDYLKLILTPSELSVSNSNPFTAVKMEPDGVYINIQHPIIHIDGSCDDYLIQWMGDNDRVRLRYDKYANVDEVVHLKNTEEGVFDYQRAGDVGRGWFSQKDKRKGV